MISHDCRWHHQLKWRLLASLGSSLCQMMSSRHRWKTVLIQQTCGRTHDEGGRAGLEPTEHVCLRQETAHRWSGVHGVLVVSDYCCPWIMKINSIYIFQKVSFTLGGGKCLWVSLAGCVFLMMWYWCPHDSHKPRVVWKAFDQSLHFLEHVCLGQMRQDMVPSRFVSCKFSPQHGRVLVVRTFNKSGQWNVIRSQGNPSL